MDVSFPMLEIFIPSNESFQTIQILAEGNCILKSCFLLNSCLLTVARHLSVVTQTPDMSVCLPG